MNPFELLELTPDASMEDIKSAYHRLAKQWHPDRFSGEEKTNAETKFRELNEAFTMLKDPNKKKAAEDSWRAQPKPGSVPGAMAPPPKPAGPSVQDRTPRDWFDEAKKSLEAGDLEQAHGFTQYAIRMDPSQADFHAFFATVLEKKGVDRRQVIRSLEQALRLNAKDVEAHIRLADHFSAIGMEARATRHLQEAREMSPNHARFKKDGRNAPPSNKVADKKTSDKQGTPAPAGLGEQAKALWNRLTGKG